MERIDWNLPLETDEPTPRAVSVYRRADDRCAVTINGGNALWYRSDGRIWSGSPLLPKIRNVRALRTSDECLQRMEAFVRRMADGWKAMGLTGPEVAEAREIVKLLPAPPVDPDLIEARKLVADAYHQDGSESYAATLDGMRDKDEAISMALAGLQRGRELAKTRDIVELVAKLIEQSEPGGAHTYRCDQNVREIAGRVASAWNGSVAQ